MTLRVIWMTLTTIIDMKRYLLHIVLVLFAVMTLAACDFGAPPRKETKQELRLRREAEWKYQRMNDSIQKARKEQREEALRKMAKDIVDPNKRGPMYKEPTDGKEIYEDGMVGFDRDEDIDDDDDIRGYSLEND